MDIVIKNDIDYSKFVEYLYSIRKQEDDYHRSRHLKVINTSKYVISIDTATLKSIAKSIYKSGYEDYLRLCTFKTYEETLIYGLILSHIRDISLLLKYIDIYVTHIDSWAECDTVISAMKIFKKIENKGDYFRHFYDMCFDTREFVARFGIVTLMVYYLEEEYIDDVLTMCKEVNTHYYYIDMAIAWLISFAFMKFKDRTYALLDSRVLTPFIQNKSICKCRDSYQISKIDKDNLIAYRIKKTKDNG